MDLKALAAAKAEEAKAKAAMLTSTASSADQAQNTIIEETKTDIPVEEGMKYYLSGAPNFKFLSNSGQIVFKNRVYKTADTQIQKLLEKDFIKRGFVTEITQAAYKVQNSITTVQPRSKFLDASTVRVGQASSADVTNPAVSVAGKK